MAEAAAEGIEIVLTPVQLATILEAESLEESSSMTNRLWGVATIVGGALELVGAAALLLTPEPTMVTKVAGTTLAVHGSDTTSTGLMQIVTGRTRTTLTSQAVEAAAEALGADPETADNVALAVDIAVPLVAGFAGAARVIAIRRGAISLAAEESAGGHTLARHVGRSEAQLRARLTSQNRIRAASSFRNLDEAQKVISEALRANRAAIREWAKTATVGTTKAFSHDAGRIIGQGVLRSTNQLHDMARVTVVLKKVEDGNRLYFVLTAFPKLI